MRWYLAPRILSLAILLAVGVGCHRTIPPPLPSVSGLDGEWTLVELDSQPAPTGAGGRRATLRFETDSARVGGFAGCNRLAASYTLAGDPLRFGVAALTRMACAEGMDLERRVTDVLNATNRYRVTATELTLFRASGSLARFARANP
jgi:heat shock protein HslJ